MDRADRLYYSPDAVRRFKGPEDGIRMRYLKSMPWDLFGREPELHTFAGLAGAASMVRSPLFGAWLDRMSQALHNEDDNQVVPVLRSRIEYIGNYVIAAALMGGEDASAELSVIDGGVMIPEVGRMLVSSEHNRRTRVSTTAGTLILQCGSTTLTLPPDEQQSSEPPAYWQPLRHIGPPGFRIALNDLDPNRDIFRYGIAGRLTAGQHQQWDKAFTEAWDIVQSYDSHAASVIQASLNTIVPASPQPFTHGKSMAAAAAFGVLGLNECRDPMRLATQLIFGIRKHMVMARRQAHPEDFRKEDDLVANRPIYAPDREGYRTVHDVHDDSLLGPGLARFFSHMTERAGPSLRAYAELSFARWYAEARQSLDLLRSSGYVTKNNARLYVAQEQEIQALAPRWAAVSEAAKQAVATSLLDRRLNWRLRTIAPDPQAITYLRNVFLRGDKCPPIAITGRLLPSRDAYTNIGPRCRYVLTETAARDRRLFKDIAAGNYDPAHFGTPTPGDIAFVCGNSRAARRYFDAALRSQPRDPEAWTGFALTFGSERSLAARALTQYPELVAATYAAAGDASIDPQAVATWLSAAAVSLVLE